LAIFKQSLPQPALLLLLILSLIGGEVRDAVTGAPIEGAIVQLSGTSTGAQTDPRGRFTLDASGTVRLRVSHIGYAARDIMAREGDTTLVVALMPSARALEGVIVRALRGDGEAPITQRVVPKEEIERGYFGQELPYLLAKAPSLTSYADAGSFAGYSYLRLRGIDQTRINITLDGVPLNEPEDQGLFFQNVPDLANSLQSVQIQRGVGTSTAGTASYAGSINLESAALSGAGRRGEIQLTRGSFDTDRASAEYQSGLAGGRGAIYARYTGQQTDGYRRHSDNRSTSGFASGAYLGARTIAKVTAFAGRARNHLAYAAAPLDAIEADPRVNPVSPRERDDFSQQFASLTITRELSPNASWATTAYGQWASGDYDVFFDPDLYNFNLASRWGGALSTWRWSGNGVQVDAGAHASLYRRDHFEKIHPDLDTRIYDNQGTKGEASGFARASADLGPVTVSGDLQVRRAWFEYTPDVHAGVAPASTDWTFVNPKIGITYQADRRVTLYASYGTNGREPTRGDMFAGFDNLDTSNVAFIGSFDRVRPERVHDLETGITLQAGDLSLGANAYAMQFRNEIAPIGALSYLGLPLRKNVASSYRRGIELDASYRLTSATELWSTATVSWNRIREYTDDASGETFGEVEPLMTPRFLSSHGLRWRPLQVLGATVSGRYASRAFLSNTGNAAFVAPAWYLLDGGVDASWGRYGLAVQVNNLLDRRAFSGGYTDGTTSYYYVQAERNIFATMKVEF
jgi:iron complex outermembrane recepter protein